MPPLVMSSERNSPAENNLIHSDTLQLEETRKRTRSKTASLPQPKKMRREHFIPTTSFTPLADLNSQAMSVARVASNQAVSVILDDEGMEEVLISKIQSRILESAEFTEVLNRVVQDHIERKSAHRKNLPPNSKTEGNEDEQDIYNVSPPPHQAAGSHQISNLLDDVTSLPSSPCPQTSTITRLATTLAESPALVHNLNNQLLNTENSEASEGTPPGMPIVIQCLPPPKNTFVPKTSENFSKKQIMSVLGGSRFAGHFYKVSKPKPGLTREVKGYYLIDIESNPFAPRTPGQHGATISSLVIPSEYLAGDLPLFVNDGSGFYIYCGQYKEPRCSDIISYNEMRTIIPEEIKQYHAKDLCIKTNKHKRKTAIAALKDQWPMIPLGWWNEATKSFDEYDESQEWERRAPCSVPISDEVAEAIEYDEIMAAFERSDCDNEPCFRLFWDYLEAVSFDKKFYQSMKAHKRKMEG